jgi:hypothetical protein
MKLLSNQRLGKIERKKTGAKSGEQLPSRQFLPGRTHEIALRPDCVSQLPARRPDPFKA